MDEPSNDTNHGDDYSESYQLEFTKREIPFTDRKNKSNNPQSERNTTDARLIHRSGATNIMNSIVTKYSDEPSLDHGKSPYK